MQTVLEGADIGSATVEPFFLAAPCAKAQCSLWRTGFVDNLADLSSNFHHAGGAGRVIDGAFCMVNGVVVPSNNDHLGGFPSDFTARDIDGALLVVGHVHEHLDDTGRSGGVEDGLFEDFTGVFGHGDKGQFRRDGAAVGR
mgnify:CR=1 FL=1